MPVPPLFPIRVRRAGGDTYVKVDHGLTAHGYPQLYIRSSGIAEPGGASSGYWPSGLHWSITDRLRMAAAAKGRVIAVWQESEGAQTSPVAVVSWHLHETGPLTVLDAGAAVGVPESQAADLLGLLLIAVRQVAQHPHVNRDPDVLRWSLVHFARVHGTAARREAQRASLERAAALGFSGVPKANRPGWADGAWMGERRF